MSKPQDRTVFRRGEDIWVNKRNDAERAVFVYVDPGYETEAALRSWGAAHRELWKAIRERGLRIEVVAVARTW